MNAMQGLTTPEAIAIWAVLGIAIVGLLYAVFLRNQILREDKGTKEMQDVWNAIKDGADAYLGKQLRSILPLVAILTIALFLSVYIVPPSPEASQWHCTAIQKVTGKEAIAACVANMTPEGNKDAYQQVQLLIGLARAIAFIMGAGFSLTVGQIGMR